MGNTDLKFRTVSSSLLVLRGLFRRVKYSLTLRFILGRAVKPKTLNGKDCGREQFGAKSLSVSGEMLLGKLDEKTVPYTWEESLK